MPKVHNYPCLFKKKNERENFIEFVHLLSLSLLFNDILLLLQTENLRRRHNWLPFIVELIKAYATQGSLTTAVDKVSLRSIKKFLKDLFLL